MKHDGAQGSRPVQALGEATADAGRAPRLESAASVRFRTLLARTIELLNEEVDAGLLASLASASSVICWDFPDVAVKTWLVVDEAGRGLSLHSSAPGVAALTVVMDSTVLREAATGERSLGAAFITGRLQVRGLSPMFLAKFVRLVDPLLRSHRAAMEELHERAA